MTRSDGALFILALAQTTYLISVWRWDLAVALYLAQHLVLMAIAWRRARPVAVDTTPLSSLACAGSLLYPFVIPLGTDPVSPIAGASFALITLGAALSLVGTWYLGRSFGVRPASRVLVEGGPYRVVRHPIYCGYAISDLGVLALSPTLPVLLTLGAGWATLLYRVSREERTLRSLPAWRAYAQRVPNKLIPTVW